MAATNFSGPVVSAGGFTGDVTGFATLPVYDVAGAPDAADYAVGTLIVVTDGNAGAGTLAYSDGTDWIASASGSAIADS